MRIDDPGLPTVILKADDLGSGGGIGLLNFRRLFSQISERQICLSVGAIGTYCSHFTPADVAYLRGIFQSEDFELWNHSDTHRDITKLTYEQQMEDTLRAQDRLEVNFGVRPRLYGAPYNRVNADSISMLESSGEFDSVWMADPIDTKLNSIPVGHLCSPEYVREVTRQPEFEEFQVRWAQRSMRRPTIVQFHPTAWNAKGSEAFGRCLDWLLAQHVRFLTFNEAVQLGLLADRPVGRAASNTPPRSLAIEADRQAHGLIEKLPDEAFDGLDRNFFGTRYRLGTQGPMRCLARSGILYSLTTPAAAQGTEKGRVLDIGCGVGDWMIAAAALAPHAIVEGIDKHPRCYKIAQQVVDHLEFGERISVHSGSAELLPFPNSYFVSAFIVNSLNYIRAESALSECWRVLKPGGKVLILLQSRAYFLRAATDALRAGNAVVARSRFTTLALQAGRSLGLSSSAGTVWTCQSEDLVRMARILGFDVLVERADVQQSTSNWNGEPLMDAFILDRGTRLRHVKDLIVRANGPTHIELGKQLIHLGCPSLLLELVDLGLLDRDTLAGADLIALAKLGSGRYPPQELLAMEGTLQTTEALAVFQLERRDWGGAVAAAASAESKDLAYLHSLALYLGGDHVAAFTAASKHASFEPRFAYLTGASACAIGRLDKAREIAETGTLKRTDTAREEPTERPFGVSPGRESPP